MKLSPADKLRVIGLATRRLITHAWHITPSQASDAHWHIGVMAGALPRNREATPTERRESYQALRRFVRG